MTQVPDADSAEPRLISRIGIDGLLLVSQGIGSLLPRTLAGRLTDRIGARPVVLAGIALAAAGTIPFAVAGQRTSEVLLSAALVVRGAGLGAATMAVMAVLSRAWHRVRSRTRAARSGSCSRLWSRAAAARPR